MCTVNIPDISTDILNVTLNELPEIRLPMSGCNAIDQCSLMLSIAMKKN